MFHSPRSRWLALLALLATGGTASAQSFANTDIYLGSASQGSALALVSSESSTTARTAALDYATFATELVAYLTKEILPDSANEFDNSLLGSHLSPSMPDQHSEFGTHCLMIVTSIGKALPFPRALAEISGEPSTLDYAARLATACLALRQVWSAFQNNVEDGRTGVSLNPKVSARRVGVSLTVHW